MLRKLWNLIRVTSTTCEHYPEGQPEGGCYWCGTYPN
jgi:hypothetical protein